MFADFGRWLAGCEGPYAKWVATYAGADFAQEADKVEALLRRLERESPELQPAIDRAIADATRREIAYLSL